ncbi:unnamed protein product [Phyllotreta striolata]|uniref:Polycystic kidney disease 2-like 1 protein n=1 Tax=Phyllotreta striolata TaxID=444603 RepID=A0A9N9TH40_PHYSR|nr:unnamed protein product [Phyllotreta striolata]
MLEKSQETFENEKEAENVGKKHKTRKTIWVTKSIAEEIGREAVLRRSLIEFTIYFAFLIFSTIYVIESHSDNGYYLTEVMKQQFLEQEFNTLNDVSITFLDIKTAADVWFYLENSLINTLFWSNPYDLDPKPTIEENEMNILYENKILGVPRLRQVKVRNDSCTIHSYFRRLFTVCYNAYSKKAEDTQPFGPGTKTAWVYSSSRETNSFSFSGKMCTYEGGGYYVDLAQTKAETVQMIQNLKDELWIRRGTRGIFLDFSVYNGNLDIFCVCKLVFEFPPTGAVIPSAKFHIVKPFAIRSLFDWFKLVSQICCYIFVAFYLLEEIREMFYFRSKYLRRFWNYIDLLIILLFTIGLILFVLFLLQVPSSLENIVSDKYGNFEYVAKIYRAHCNVVAVALFLIYFKAFKFLNFNRTMSQLNDTLSKCAMDMLGFSLMFFIIFFAYAELGYLLFGNQVEEFNSFHIAMFTLLRTILGDFDYQKIQEANRILAPVYFLSYIFLVFFVLLNMFLAIISDAYGDVKTELNLAPKEMQMTEYIRKHFSNFLQKLGCGKCLPKQLEGEYEANVLIQEIREILKKCGYSDLEIEMFFSRYNIDPLEEERVGESKNFLEELQVKLDDGRIKLEDFKSQQERLIRIESLVGELVNKLKEILDKLDSLSNVTKEIRHK